MSFFSKNLSLDLKSSTYQTSFPAKTADFRVRSGACVQRRYLIQDKGLGHHDLISLPRSDYHVTNNCSDSVCTELKFSLGKNL